MGKFPFWAAEIWKLIRQAACNDLGEAMRTKVVSNQDFPFFKTQFSSSLNYLEHSEEVIY